MIYLIGGIMGFVMVVVFKLEMTDWRWWVWIIVSSTALAFAVKLLV